MKPLTKKNIEDIIALTPLQEGMLFHYLQSPGSDLYFEQLSLGISGEVDTGRFGAAWDRVAQTNGALRTLFRWEKAKKPFQVVLEKHPVRWVYYDFSGLDNNEREKSLQKITNEDRQNLFDLREIPFRVTLCKMAAGRYRMIVSHHHILYDGWSGGIILKEFIKAYHDFSNGSVPLRPRKTGFKEFVKWHHEHAGKADERGEAAFWRDYLRGIEPVELPVKKRVNAVKPADSSSSGSIRVSFSPGLKDRLEGVVKDLRLTLGTVIYSAWGILLQKYNNCDDAVFGTTVSGRPAALAGIEEMVGLFINTLPLRITAFNGEKIEHLLQRTAKNLRTRQIHEHTPPVKIKKYAGLAGSEELFDSIVVLENYPLAAALDPSLSFHSYTMTERTHYDLTVTITVFHEIECHFLYRPGVLADDTVERLSGHFLRIVEALAGDPDRPAARIEILSQEEKQRLLADFNDTAAAYPREKTIHQLFERQADKTPHRIALVGPGAPVNNYRAAVTYKELNRLAGGLARRLRQKGVQPGAVAGIMMERSIEMMTGILAILKAGAAYLPMDPGHPRQRAAYMLADSGANVLVTTRTWAEENDFSPSPPPPFSPSHPTSPAYVIYTSGSTGKPKGVIIEHRQFLNFIKGMTAVIDFNESDALLSLTTISFDIFGLETLVPLTVGTKVVLADRAEQLNPVSAASIMEQEKITIFQTTPSRLQAMLTTGEFSHRLKFSRCLLVGGEPFPPALLEKVRGLTEGKIYNLYGPTETTVWSTVKDLSAGQALNIGKPINNTRIYILSKAGLLQPLGVPGELWIGGEGLARGYLNRPELTAERFIHPSHIYKTGDLARWLPDGDIECLGRLDFQVKIRGFRVELGEIENRLLLHGDIKEAVVVHRMDVDGGGDGYLCAYVAARGCRTVDIAELKNHLSQSLPEYMVPAVFTVLENLPLTPSGKIHRKALPEPLPETGDTHTYMAPRDDLEKQLAGIWADVLNTNKGPVGIKANFFRLGGHSLKAVELVAAIHRQLGVNIPLAQIFDHPCIEKMAAFIKKAAPAKYRPLEKVETKEYYALSPAQKRMYFLWQMNPGATAYNMPQAVIMEKGTAAVPGREWLSGLFGQLLRRHESLRTSFFMKDNRPVQRIHEENYQLHITNHQHNTNDGLQIKKIIKEFVCAFDLARAPLLRVGVVPLDSEKHLLLMDMHHIVSDGTSMAILTGDFLRLYRGEEPRPLELQYKDFARWRGQEAAGAEMAQRRQYWLNHLGRGGDIPRLNLPFDFARPEVFTFQGDRCQSRLSAAETGAFKKMCRQLGVTEFMALLAAFNVLLHRYCGEEDIVTGSVMAGRDHAGLDGIVGMFVETLALRNYPHGDKPFDRFLGEVRRACIGAFENRGVPFEELVDRLEPERDPSRNPLFDVCFIFQDLEFPGEALAASGFKPCTYHHGTTQFDLSLEGLEQDGEMVFRWDYYTRLARRETIERLPGHFINIIRQVSRDPGLPPRQIRLLTDVEKETLLYDFNRKKPLLHKENRTLHGEFENRAAKTPDAAALVGPSLQNHGAGTHQLSYRHVNERAAGLAVRLREKGVKPDGIVGIMLGPSLEMITAMLAVLKAGGAYLPLDPDYPQERIDYMLADSNVLVLVSAGTFACTGPAAFSFSPSYPLPLSPSSLMAYVIYTSGTTGRPRGVAVNHGSITAYLDAFYREIEITAEDTFIQLNSCAFDASVEEIFSILLRGGKIVIPGPGQRKDIHILVRLILRHRVTSITCTPLLLNEFNRLCAAPSSPSGNSLKSLRKFISGGDVLKREYIQRLLSIGTVYNGYGPTEATVAATFYRCPPGPGAGGAGEGSIPIGRPLANYNIYILDRYDRLLPMGIPGELCIGGTGVSRGYLNHPELTAERFIFYKSYRLYRTGDLARWLPDGNIQFLGRIDRQVKVRGFRIETAEIEAHLRAHPHVGDAVVVKKETARGEGRLCAYIVGRSDNKSPVEVKELRAHLAGKLPGYMVPAFFMPLEKFPLAPTGKINLEQLPAPGFAGFSRRVYRPPASPLEKILADTWSEVLGIERVSSDDNFFQVGGDSIKALRVSSRLRDYRLKLKVGDLFLKPTIKDLAGCIGKIDPGMERGLEGDEGEGESEAGLTLTPIQHWFFEQDFSRPHHFNQAVMLYRRQGFSGSLVLSVFQKLAEHHDALRMVFAGPDNRGNTAKPLDIAVFNVENNDGRLMEREIAQAAEKVQASIDLEQGPPVKLALFKTPDGDHLLMVIHHLVVDGVSWRILLEDFAVGYARAGRGEEILFPAGTHSFKRWAQCLKEYGESGEVLKQLSYWRTAAETAVEPLPKDREATAEQLVWENIVSRDLELPPEETAQLLQGVHHAYNTGINDFLLAALGLAIKEWAGPGLQTLVIDLEGHGREDIIEGMDISRTVGWFTSLFPVVLELGRTDDPPYFLKEVKETLRRVPHKGIGYGILRYLTPKEKTGGTAFRPEAEIGFNYLGRLDNEISAELFEMSPLKTGSPIGPKCRQIHTIDINGRVKGSRLSLVFSYNRFQYRRESIDGLISSYRSHLLALIRHCRQKRETEPTPSDLVYDKIGIRQLEELQRELGGEKVIENIYPLSPMQAGMYFHIAPAKETGTYFEQITVTLSGPVDAGLLAAGLNRLVHKYDILRTLFIQGPLQEPVQVVLKERPLTVAREDISHLPANQREAFMETFKENDRQQGFHLAADIPMRVSLFLYREKPLEYKLVWSFSHILMDGWCMGILLKELLELYRSPAAPLPAVTPYRDYIRWLGTRDRRAGLEYWRRYLDGYEQPAGLPASSPALSGGENHEYKVDNYYLELAPSFSRDLEAAALRGRVTVNTLFQTLWALLLQRYNNTEDVVFGTVVSGRPAEIAGIADMVGLFINTLPVRAAMGGIETLSALMQRVQEQGAASQDYQYLPLADIQSLSPLKNRLVQHLMVFENYPLADRLSRLDLPQDDEGGTGFTITNPEAHEQTNYDFNLIILPGSGFRLKFNFNAAVYDRELIERVAGHFKTVLTQVVGQPDRDIQLAAVDITPREEKQVLLYRFNGAAKDYPAAKTIHQWFREEAAKKPDGTAVIGEFEPRKRGSVYIGYNELDHRSDDTARLLRGRGVGPGSVVGLMMERSPAIIIALLGILKAGAAYLPIDPGYPGERKQYILKDSGAEILLATGRTAHSAWERRKGRKGDRQIKSLRPAYIIYTSGSTGRPKGLILEHRGLVNLINYHHCCTGIDCGRVGQFASISFDVSFQEIFTALLAGGTLVIIPEQIKTDIPGLCGFIRRHDTRTVFLPPSYLKTIFSHRDYASQFPGTVGHIVAAGEQLVVVDRFRRYLKENNVCLHNHYGPSETHVVTALSLDPAHDIPALPPIGKPLTNTVIYILDRALHLQPIGAPGELYIGGPAVGRGYLNNPELTAERFIVYRSHRSYTSYKTYRTGDLARWLADGSLEFLGRMDFQVKIRGFRIELAEIESCLLAHGRVKEAVVIDRRDRGGDKYLCAYIVPAHHEPGLEGELREYLAGLLPGYMVPAYFVSIGDVPLNSSGKLNRRALPAPAPGAVGGTSYEAPSSETQEELTEIWAGALAVDSGKIGIHDDFFHLGGHSLKAAVVIAAIHKRLNVKVLLPEFFKNTTVAKLAGLIDRAGQGRKDSPTAVRPLEKKEYYPLSAAQERLYFLRRMDENSTVYNIPLVFSLGKDTDKNKLENALKKLLDRHESLRTSFIEISGVPFQRVHESGDVDFSLVYGEVERETPGEILDRYVKSFDLTRAPLMRSCLLERPGGDFYWLMDLHHIVSDGTSQTILRQDFQWFYHDREPAPTPAPGLLKLQYKDFAAWQNRLYAGAEMEARERYWLRMYSGDIPRLDLPADYQRPEVFTFAGGNFQFNLDHRETAAFKGLITRYGGTLFMHILAVLHTLFYKTTGQCDIIIGTAAAGRAHADVQRIIGMFVNTLALRNYPQGEKTYESFLKEVIRGSIAALENREVQLEKLIEKLDLERDLSRNPLFDVSLVVQDFAAAAEDRETLPGPPLSLPGTSAKFDLTFIVYEKQEEIHVDIEYYTGLFKHETIERLASHVKRILGTVVKAPRSRLKDIPIISPAEKRGLLYAFNDTARDCPPDKTVHRLFEEQVDRTPLNTAVVDGDRHLSFGCLDERANRVADYLGKERMIGPGHRVGIVMDRSAGLIITLLGILKTGAAYVPMEPSLPAERRKTVAADAGIEVMVTGESYIEICNRTGLDAARPPVPVTPRDLAYVLYTSGTSGTPRGVMVEHRGLVNYLCWGIRRYIGDKRGSNRYFPFYTSISFDLTVTSIYLPLLSGGTMVVYQNRESGLALLEIFGKGAAAVDTVKVTPSHLKLLAAELGENGPGTKGPTCFIVGGEQLETGLAAGIYRAFAGKVAIYNEYGPTEATVGCMIHRYQYEDGSVDGGGEAVPIGGPIDNAKIYLLDRDFNPVPVNVAGEIYIGGDVLARGYLNRPELTAEKFFHPSPIYKTNDLARRMADGNIQFLGRTDEQVKVRGYRIETGEIEIHLSKHPAVKEAVVVPVPVHSGGEKHDRSLCAYIVWDGNKDKDKGKGNVDELRDFLARYLPAYMIPSYFTELAEIPLTANGKLDRRRLPEPAVEVSAVHRNPTAPAGAIEEKLSAIWSDILGLAPDAVGMDGHFFRLGGHSLKAAIMTSRIHKELKVKVPLAQVFKKPTLRELARYIRLAGPGKDTFREIEPIEKKEYYPLSYNQERLWIMRQIDGQSTAYHMTAEVPLTHRVDEKVFGRVIQQLTRRHESFRTRFLEVDDIPVQAVVDRVDAAFEMVDIPGLSREEREKNKGQIYTRLISKPFDFSKAPLFRSLLVKEAEGVYLAVFCLHHIISDGWSMDLLSKEFSRLYEAGGKGGPAGLAPQKLHYKDFTLWHNRHIADPAVKEKYHRRWEKKLARGMPILRLPADYSPDNDDNTAAGYEYRLNNETGTRLNRLAEVHNTTLAMVMFTAYNILLAQLCGQQDIICSLISAGRDHVSLADIAGYFVQSVPVVTRVNPGETFRDLLTRTAADVGEIFEYQNYPPELVLDELKISYPEISAAFNLLNNRPSAAELQEEPRHTVEYSRQAAFALELYLQEYNDGIRMTWNYKKALFKPSTIELIVRGFLKLLDYITRPDTGKK